jgi:hypothetical protein
MPTSASLQAVADSILRLAKRQSFITPRDVRAELRMAGVAETEWKAVIALVQNSLVHRQGRYYHKEAFSPRLQKEHAQQQAIQKAIRRLIREHRSQERKKERRDQERIDFVQPVKVRTEDGKEHALMSRDLSSTGVRLLGTQRFLGQRVQLELSDGDGKPVCRLLVRILWTCSVGDELFENGGNFLELLD